MTGNVEQYHTYFCTHPPNRYLANPAPKHRRVQKYSPAINTGLVFASTVVVNGSLGEIHVQRGQGAYKQSLEAHARHRG